MSDFDDFLKEVDSILGQPSPKKEEPKKSNIDNKISKKSENFKIEDVKIILKKKKQLFHICFRRNMMIY
jgi:hypothetical protein